MRTLASALLALALIAPSGASAATAKPVAAVTIGGCKADALTVTGSVKATGAAAKKVRGARLRVRFVALPMFGLPRNGQERDLGARKSGSAAETFTGLTAGPWTAVMRWRWVKGRKAVASGDKRAEPGRVGRAKGSALCTLDEGFKVLDTTPPQVSLAPSDDLWHRAPAAIFIRATDDFSGVVSVNYRVDEGPISQVPNGRSFSIENEGLHTVFFSAADVAGNAAAPQEAQVRVDANPPTKPVLNGISATASTRPTFRWSASTDSASGLRGYGLGIQRASDGQLLSLTAVEPGATSAQSPIELADGASYTVTLSAVDNTSPEPFITNSDPMTFRVDSALDVTGVDPPNGAIIGFDRKDGNVTVSLDRPADPSTVATSTVLLSRDPSPQPAYTVACGNPCTTITIDPDATLAEGRYTLSLAGVKSDEGVQFPDFSSKFAATFYDNAFEGGQCGFTGAGWDCGTHPGFSTASHGTTDPARMCSVNGADSVTTSTSSAIQVTTTQANEQVRIAYDWRFVTTDSSDDARTQVQIDGGAFQGNGDHGQSGSPQQDLITVTVPAAGTHPLTIRNQVTLTGRTGCIGTQDAGDGYAIDNVFASRLP